MTATAPRTPGRQDRTRAVGGGRRPTRHGRGFTLVELVLVLAVLGVLAVVAIPRLFDRNVFDERGFFDEALAGVRYAQKHSMATGCDTQVAFTGAGFVLNGRAGGCTSGAFTASVAHPSRPGAFQSSAPTGVSVGPVTTFYFDKIGRPRDTGGALLGAATVIGVGGLSLAIEPETGYAHEQ